MANTCDNIIQNDLYISFVFDMSYTKELVKEI